jgi:predicted nuclease with TOPRIM domain
LRKERAQTDIRLQEEISKNQALHADLEELQRQLAASKEELKNQSDQQAKELQDVKKLLSDSIKREAQLRELNQEAYELLSLNGVQLISSRIPFAQPSK